MIPAIGAAYLIRDQEDGGRKAIASQQRPGVREKVEVAIIKGDEHGAAGQRSFCFHRRVPVLQLDAVIPGIAQITELLLKRFGRHPVAGRRWRAGRRDTVVHEDREPVGDNGLRRIAVPEPTAAPQHLRGDLRLKRCGLRRKLDDLRGRVT